MNMPEVRCFCNKKPLLAVCGRDAKTGEPFVHIKTWKGNRLYVEAIVTSGIVRLRCRECYRWHTVNIVRNDIRVQEEKLPESISSRLVTR